MTNQRDAFNWKPMTEPKTYTRYYKIISSKKLSDEVCEQLIASHFTPNNLMLTSAGNLKIASLPMHGHVLKEIKPKGLSLQPKTYINLLITIEGMANYDVQANQISEHIDALCNEIHGSWQSPGNQDELLKRFGIKGINGHVDNDNPFKATLDRCANNANIDTILKELKADESLESLCSNDALKKSSEMFQANVEEHFKILQLLRENEGEYLLADMNPEIKPKNLHLPQLGRFMAFTIYFDKQNKKETITPTIKKHLNFLLTTNEAEKIHPEIEINPGTSHLYNTQVANALIIIPLAANIDHNEATKNLNLQLQELAKLEHAIWEDYTIEPNPNKTIYWRS